MAIGAMSRNIRTVEVVSNVPEQIKKIKSYAKEFDEYYYIIHDMDKDEDGSLKKPHIHCIVYDRGGTTLARWCARWSGIVPPNFVENKICKPQAVRYLTHETQKAIEDGKYKYPRTSVITNVPEKYNNYFNDTEHTVSEKLDDFLKLKNKQMTVQEFCEKYRSEIYNLNFYQQSRLFGDLVKYGL